MTTFNPNSEPFGLPLVTKTIIPKYITMQTFKSVLVDLTKSYTLSKKTPMQNNAIQILFFIIKYLFESNFYNPTTYSTKTKHVVACTQQDL